MMNQFLKYSRSAGEMRPTTSITKHRERAKQSANEVRMELVPYMSVSHHWLSLLTRYFQFLGELGTVRYASAAMISYSRLYQGKFQEMFPGSQLWEAAIHEKAR